jgi:hypothetical protein
METNRTPASTEDVETIEGGFVTSTEDLVVKVPTKDATARSIALMLVSILGLSAAIHYFTIAVLVWNDKPDVADRLGHFFNAWLPIISSLVGSAITYYFTREKS